MTVDVASVKERFEEFADTDADLIEMLLEEAVRMHATDVWGARLDDGIRYYTAHLTAIALQSKDATNGQAKIKGPLMSEHVGPLRRDFASLGFSSKLERDDMWFMSTPYGAHWLFLRSQTFAPRVFL